MPLSAYARLTQVDVDADLTLLSPGGRQLRIVRTPGGELSVSSDDGTALWEAFDLARSLGLVDLDHRSLRQLRNPLQQALKIGVGDRDVIYWPAGKLPRILSLRGLLSLLRRRRN